MENEKNEHDKERWCAMCGGRPQNKQGHAALRGVGKAVLFVAHALEGRAPRLVFRCGLSAAHTAEAGLGDVSFR